MVVPCVLRSLNTVLQLRGSLTRLTVCHECSRAKAGTLVHDMKYSFTIQLHDVNEHRTVDGHVPRRLGHRKEPRRTRQRLADIVRLRQSVQLLAHALGRPRVLDTV